jgi:hypothetical protein
MAHNITGQIFSKIHGADREKSGRYGEKAPKIFEK